MRARKTHVKKILPEHFKAAVFKIGTVSEYEQKQNYVVFSLLEI
jgi:hypothetical protein